MNYKTDDQWNVVQKQLCGEDLTPDEEKLKVSQKVLDEARGQIILHFLEAYGTEGYDLSKIDSLMVAKCKKTYQTLKVHKYIMEDLVLKKKELQDKFQKSDSLKERDMLQRNIDAINNYNPNFTPFLHKFPLTSQPSDLSSSDYSFLIKLLDNIQFYRDGLELDQEYPFGEFGGCDIDESMMKVMFGENEVIHRCEYGFTCKEQFVSYQDLSEIRDFIPDLIKRLIEHSVTSYKILTIK